MGRGRGGSRQRTPTSAVPDRLPVVLLVDDHPLWRQTLRNVLLRAKAASDVIEAADGREAVVAAQRTPPDVVVMDIQMPDMNGVEATRAIKEGSPGVRVLMLSSTDDKGQVLEAVRAGAAGYVLKSSEPADIVEAVRRVHQGDLIFPGELASVVLSELRSPGSDDDEASSLPRFTARERAVLELMADGLSNHAIAKDLALSPKTVESHVASVFVKLGLLDSRDEHRRVAAVVKYLRAVGFDDGAS